ncbi:MAG: hypothetical protein WB810_14435 [Candidatus Cybelea sp.]
MVTVSVVTIGVISAAWVLLTAFSLWWFVIRSIHRHYLHHR